MMSAFIIVQHDLKNKNVKLSGPGALSPGIWARVLATSSSEKASSSVSRF